MYELLLSWGIENLAGLAKTRDAREVAILIEAIRAKNALVIERFKLAAQACDAILDLALKVEDDVATFATTAPKTNNTRAKARTFLGALRNATHPACYRRMKKLRARFECTSDILSAYSFRVSGILHPDVLAEIVEHKKQYSATDILRTYRGMWMLYADVLARLLRLTANDLRFWLVDTPHVSIADRFANDDVDHIKRFMLAHSWPEGRLELILQQPGGLRRFWKAVEESTAA
jgi:hypothetical protein